MDFFVKQSNADIDEGCLFDAFFLIFGSTTFVFSSKLQLSLQALWLEAFALRANSSSFACRHAGQIVNAPAGSRTWGTSMGGLYVAPTLQALLSWNLFE